jgi:hypothetical protein
VSRLVFVLTVALATLAVSAGPAGANPPPGDWTFVRKDAFKHYACKVKVKDGWRVRTATWFNNSDAATKYDIGVYVALARGSNRNLVAKRDDNGWERGYIRFLLRGAEESDRLWMQGSYYGPSEPWSDGFSVRRLVRCASAA